MPDHAPGRSRFMRLVSALETSAFLRKLRFRFLVFEVKRCPEDDFLRASFPLAVFLNRLAADLLVFVLGTNPTPISLSVYSNPGLLFLS